MLHKMKLQQAPFSQISKGKKTIELRLWDEKRQKIAVGDMILFTCNFDASRSLMCTVVALHRFSSFAQLYATLPMEKCGYENPRLANPDDMLLYYSEEEQKKYGVVGIEIELI